MSNDNENRGLPADIDLLITSAKQLIRIRDNESKIQKRITNLSNAVNRIEPQYKEVMKKSNWKELKDEKPSKEAWYITKRTIYDSPSVTLYIPSFDGFGKNKRITLWCEIPK